MNSRKRKIGEGTDQRGGRGGTESSTGGAGGALINGSRHVDDDGFSVDSVRTIAEVCGVTALPQACCALLADDVTFRVKLLIQEAQKVALRRKRACLGLSELEAALSQLGEEPIYGASCGQALPLRCVTGGGREVFFHEDEELDLAQLMTADTPKVPQEVTLKAHWLALEGRQPSVPENPPAEGLAEQRRKALNPVLAVGELDAGRTKSHWQLTVAAAAKARPGTGGGGGAKGGGALKGPEQAHFKDISAHEISVEQQFYYKELTEACVGSNEEKRSEALRSLATDSGLHQLLPRLVTFICEGIRVNVLNNNLALLIYLMRMIKFLLENPYIYMEKYLHQLVPNIVTCAVSRTLCARPDTDNHWALRDFAAKQLAALCAKFSSPAVEIQARVCQLVCAQLERPATPLSAVYGCLTVLCELGADTVRAVLLPLLAGLSARLQPFLETGAAAGGHATAGAGGQELREADKCRAYLVAQLAPVLRGRYATLEELRADVGRCLAADLWREMCRLQRVAGSASCGGGAGGGAATATAALNFVGPQRTQRALLSGGGAVATGASSLNPGHIKMVKELDFNSKSGGGGFM